MTVSTLDRRSFFKKLRNRRSTVGKKGVLGKAQPIIPAAKELPPVPPPTTTLTISGGLDPYTGAWDYAQVAHLLRRTMFGLKKSDVDQFLSLGMEAAVDQLLDVDLAAPDPPINNYYFEAGPNSEGYLDPVIALGDTWVNATYDGEAEGLRIESLRGWWTNLMIEQDATIREKMVLFWHNHFATQASEVFWGKVNYNHNVKLRAKALGNFKELTKVVTLDPMMLFYLNGFLNNKYAPDENYARELQELFTIGKDNPDQYTEDDVYQAARVLTGWTIEFPMDNDPSLPANQGELKIETDWHDMEDKQFSSFYDNTVIPGDIGMEAELDMLMDMIFAKDEVALFICRKLYRWFVYYHIDETVEQEVIVPLAAIFRDNNYEIKPVMETLLKSEHFYDAVNKGCFIKTPVDLVVGTLRGYDMHTDATNLYNQLVFQYFMNVNMANMQMVPGDPPNVAGWQAFRQFPQFYRMWINSDTARNRNLFTDAATFTGFGAIGETMDMDHIAFADTFDEPSDPVQLIEDMTQFLLPQPLSDTKKTLLKSILLTGLPNDSYWTTAWFDYINDPNDPMALEVVTVRLTTLHNYIMKLPEYQLA